MACVCPLRGIHVPELPLGFIPPLHGRPCSAAGSCPPEPLVADLELLAESNSMGTSPAR